jgi:hypothetical protein
MFDNQSISELESIRLGVIFNPILGKGSERTKEKDRAFGSDENIRISIAHANSPSRTNNSRS